MELGVGETLTVAEALERSDHDQRQHTAAVMLGSRVGAGRITANNAALGLDSTHYSLERMTTSALDMLHLLFTVSNGQCGLTGSQRRAGCTCSCGSSSQRPSAAPVAQ